MNRPDSLASLFARRVVGGDVEFRQGVVVTWDSATGSNSVDVGGVILSDLPALNIGDFVVLQPGDVVGINKVGNTYFIMGRIQLPGPPDVNRAVLDIDIQDETNLSFAQQTTFNAKISVDIPMPTWIREGDEVAVSATFVCTSRNSTAATDRLMTRITFSSVDPAADLYTTSFPFVDVPAGTFGQSVATGALNIPAWAGVDPGEILRVTGYSSSWLANWATNADNKAQLQTTAIIRRTQ